MTNATEGIFHSRHAAGDLLYNDPGNPTWLILTSAIAAWSSDGISWNQAAHGIPGLAGTGSCCAAYSRLSNRWCVTNGSASIWYSDDNGATWTSFANVLDQLPQTGAPGGANHRIVSDGYGVFVYTDGIDRWVSTNDGEDWRMIPRIYTHVTNSVALGYGNGHFIWASSAGAGVPYVSYSLRE
jgi:hypothetical protein